jgi:predicted acylesterase/phospholipase RssA
VRVGKSLSRGPLKRELEKVYGAHTLGDFSKPALAITATEIEGGRIRVFSTLTTKTDAQLKLVDVVMASAALPGAFGYYSIIDPEQNLKRHYIDGGLWANSPMLAAVALAVENGASLSDIRIISLGTASSEALWKPAEYAKLRVMSKKFFRCLFDVVSSAAEETSSEAVQRLIGWQNMLHIDGLTQKQITAWDVDKAIEELPRIAADLAADPSELSRLKELVS